MVRLSLVCLPLATLILPAVARPLELSNVFSSHMVLQQDRPAPLWGWADPGERVTTTLMGEAFVTVADETGFWKQMLPAGDASLIGYDMVVNTATDSITLEDVVFGEVIFCSGQSNMVLSVRQCANASEEAAAANAYPHIRIFSGPEENTDTLNSKGVFDHPHDQTYYLRSNWTAANENTIGCADGSCAGPHGIFSAVCWHTARNLADSLGGTVPVGAIVQGYGGTSIQYWMSEDALRESNAPEATQCCGQNGGPSSLWNTQIHPYTLGPMQFSAVVWFQGEQNANCGGPTQVEGGEYSTMLQTLVSDWRLRFMQPDMPFGVVLLAAWRHDEDITSFPLLRLAQANLTATMFNTFLISSLDQGEPVNGSVHSPYKREIGRRAAMGVRALAMGQAVPHMGPRYASALAVPAGSTGIVSVRFMGYSLYDGLVMRSGVTCPTGFEANCEEFAVLSAPDCVWHAATATVSKSDHNIDLHPESWSEGLRPVATRGFFANWPIVTVANSHDFPAEPWREYIEDMSELCPLDSPTLVTSAAHLLV